MDSDLPSVADLQRQELLLNVHRSSPCRCCGSLDTSRESILRPSPSVVATYFIGTLYILWRTAFRVKTEICYQCGASRRYRTTGARIALWLLVIYLGLSAWGLISAFYPSALRRTPPPEAPFRRY